MTFFQVRFDTGVAWRSVARAALGEIEGQRKRTRKGSPFDGLKNEREAFRGRRTGVLLMKTHAAASPPVRGRGSKTATPVVEMWEM
ncbi:MAG TPA: hypothetical protein ENH89_03970 [Aurantimonas coralicida]|uniref:Uncharacterized protein n=1 Tax=Aurantimonas coralicida TaxID=182270 RepID=A0A9C9NCJ7_9HYPH|nr:hypothetical protein [Aurantimonas coralicida]